MRNPFSQTLAFLIALVMLTACDAASEDEDTGPDGATPTTTVAQAVGPVNQLVATDTLNVADEISENTAIALQEIYNFQEAERGDRFFQAAINQGAANSIFNFETDTGTLAIEDLAVALTSDSLSTPNNWPGNDCTEDGTCNCTFGGTRDYTGTLDITSNTSEGSGTVSGNYDITYTDCIEPVSLEVSDTPCITYVNIVNGTLEQTVNIAFSNFVETTSFEDYATSSDLDVAQTTVMQAPLSFTLSGSPTGTFTAEDTATFDFVYDFTDGTAQIQPNGSVVYDSVEYNMVVMQNFVEDSTNAEVCQ